MCLGEVTQRRDSLRMSLRCTNAPPLILTAARTAAIPNLFQSLGPTEWLLIQNKPPAVLGVTGIPLSQCCLNCELESRFGHFSVHVKSSTYLADKGPILQHGRRAFRV